MKKDIIYNIVCESVALLEFDKLSDEEIEAAKKKLNATKKYALTGAAIGGIPTALFYTAKGDKADIAHNKQEAEEYARKAEIGTGFWDKMFHRTARRKSRHDNYQAELLKGKNEYEAGVDKAKYKGDNNAFKKALQLGAVGAAAGAVAGRIHDYGVSNQLKGKATKKSLFKSALGGAGIGAALGASHGYMTKSAIRDKAWGGAGLGTLAGIGAGMLYNKGVQKARDYIVDRNKKKEMKELSGKSGE